MKTRRRTGATPPILPPARAWSWRFPRGFAWGVATAAAQIEGAAGEDGKGESIWDRYCRAPGSIRDGGTPEIACDHYHRYRDDCALMRRLGVRHYRMSIAWPRIFPAGRGAVNQQGVDFYLRLFDALAANGVTPWVTMFHWDLPQALEDEGGWRSRRTVDAFATYADTIVRRFSDCVRNWITLNEIICFTRYGYGGGDKAPGASEGEAVVNQTYHHALLCHGHGVRAVREHGRRGARVGLADNPVVPVPVTETPADIAAARRVFVEANIRVLDPIFRRRYSPDYLRSAGAARPKVAQGDFALVSLPTDFLGLNIYTGQFVRADARGNPQILPLPTGYPRADPPWLNYVPQAMYWGPRLARDVYGVHQIYITENGAGFNETPNQAGEVMDLHRRDYVRNCLHELHRAVVDGVNVRGYFLWSLLDNFEWQDGYAMRFGICHTDYATQQRTPKLSAHWYSTVMRENRLV